MTQLGNQNSWKVCHQRTKKTDKSKVMTNSLPESRISYLPTPVSGPRKANTCPGQEYRNLIRMLCCIFFLQQVKLTKTNILPYKYITSNTDCDLLTVPKNSEDTIHQWKENLGSKDNNSGQNHVSKWKQQEITRIKDKGIVNSRNQRTEKSRTRTH